MSTPEAENNTETDPHPDMETAEPAGGFHSFYGAGPRHLVGLLLALALTVYTLSVIGLSALWNPDVWWQSILVWFLGAIIAHDLIVFPLYAAVDRVLSRFTRSGERGHPDRQGRTGVTALNYLRVPLIAVALMFGLFFPGILGQGASTYLDATGQTQDPFLRRWLLLSAVVFGVAAVAYVLRLLTHRRGPSTGQPTAWPPESGTA